MEKRKSAIFIIIIMLIILAIALISYLKNNNSIDEETAKCIASKSRLYVSKTCSHCEQQKEILGNYSSYFKIIDCIDNNEECRINNIIGIPTWIINGKKDIGVKSLKELKSLADC